MRMSKHGKEKRWKELEEKARETGDRLGMGIDKGIMPVVVGLWAHGIDTTASCEGHLDHGEIYPWVRIEVFVPAAWEEQEDDWRKDARKRSYLRRRNAPMVVRSFALLSSFYAERGRQRAYADELVIADVNQSWGDGSLQPLEGPLLRFLPGKTGARRLHVYQKEMTTFGHFLREKFFRD